MKTKIKKFLREKVKILVIGICFIIGLAFFIPLRQSFGMGSIPEGGPIHDIIEGTDTRGITDDSVWDEIKRYREGIGTALPDDVDNILETDLFDEGFTPDENIPTASPPGGDFIPHFPFGFHIGGGAYNAGSEQDDESNITVGGISFKKSGDAAISGSLIVNDNNIFREADATCNPAGDACQRDYGIISEGKESGVIAKSNKVGMKGIGKLTGIIGEGGAFGGVFSAVDIGGTDITESQVALGVNFGGDLVLSILSLGATLLTDDLFIDGNIAGLGSPVTINDNLVVNGNIGRFYLRRSNTDLIEPAANKTVRCEDEDIIINCSGIIDIGGTSISVPGMAYGHDIPDNNIKGMRPVNSQLDIELSEVENWCLVENPFDEDRNTIAVALCFSPDG